MRDIRYAIRALVRTPTVTLTSLLVMALGIGATTAVFSVANAVLFRPLPYADPERLVQFGTVGILEFQAYREQSQSFEGLISFGAVNKNLYDAAAPERISVVAAERGLFDLLGVRPLVGRTFLPNDPLNVAVISEGFWRRRYGGTPPTPSRPGRRNSAFVLPSAANPGAFCGWCSRRAACSSVLEWRSGFSARSR